MEKSKKLTEQELNKKSVLRAHNITYRDKHYWCNDGDGFKDIWNALEHTIWLDLNSKTINTEDGKERDCNDYYEILNERESHESMEEVIK